VSQSLDNEVHLKLLANQVHLKLVN